MATPAKKTQPAVQPEPQPEAVIEFGTVEVLDYDNGCAADRARYGNCVGRATPGARVCSRHAMHYRADGTPREG